MTHQLIYVTCADSEEAERIASALLEKRLVACANILPGMRSLYHWQGEVAQSAEAVLLLKTTRDAFADVKARLLALHSYDTPCILAFDIQDGHAPFLQWISDNVKPANP